MTRRLLPVVSLFAMAVALPQAQRARPASPTRTHVEVLASEKFEGRLAGSAGERLAAEYIAAELRRIGARPLPGRADMFQAFQFTAGSSDGGSTLTVTSGDQPRRQTFTTG